MANQSIKLDVSELEKAFSFVKDINKRLSDAMENLAQAAYAQAIKLAQTKLKETRNIFLENFSLVKEGSASSPVYVLLLKEKAVWIDEGFPEHNMKDTHLNGKDSMVIPFQHNKNQSSMMGENQKARYNEIKKFLKKQGVGLDKPINDNSGKPIISSKNSVKAAKSFANVPSAKVGKVSGESVLNRLNIYQHEVRQKDGSTKVAKTMMTFRTLSSKSGPDEWQVPARKAADIMDETFDFIIQNYQRILTESITNLIAKNI